MTSEAALLIVDLQNDFCEGGSLAVSGGLSLVEQINELIASRRWSLIVASKDWHPRGHVSFASAHAGAKPFDTFELKSKTGKTFVTTLWPDHCVDGTAGAEIVEGLNISEVDDIVYKGMEPDVEIYSAFRDVFGENETALTSMLQRHHIREVVIVGLAFEVCVLHTALDAAHDGYKTVVDMRATRAIDEAGAAKARQRLQEAGVELAHS